MPIPVSLRFPDDPESHEDDWQELVLRHLEIDDRVILTIDDELDVLGPFAQETLRRHGPLFPANAHLHVPIAAQARGGTVLTGFGGDELLTTSPLCQRVNRLLLGEVRPEPRDALRLAAFYGPRSLRRVAMNRHMGNEAPRAWMRPQAMRTTAREETDDLVSESLRWDHSIDRWWRTRYRSLVQYSTEQVMAMRGSTVCSPFASPEVLTSMAREWGRVGVPSRTEAMKSIFGDLLPPAVTARDSKASFGGPFSTRATAPFARQWDGSGVDHELVDPEVLRRLWLGEEDSAPDFRASLLIQSAWLATDTGE